MKIEKTLKYKALNISTSVLLLRQKKKKSVGKKKKSVGEKTHLWILIKLWEVIWRMNSLGQLKVVVLC